MDKTMYRITVSKRPYKEGFISCCHSIDGKYSIGNFTGDTAIAAAKKALQHLSKIGALVKWGNDTPQLNKE